MLIAHRISSTPTVPFHVCDPIQLDPPPVIIKLFMPFQISIVAPRDPLLFRVHDDVTFSGALRAACLVGRADAEEEMTASPNVPEITLDTTVEEEGLNLLGQARPFVTVWFDLSLTTIEQLNPVAMSR